MFCCLIAIFLPQVVVYCFPPKLMQHVEAADGEHRRSAAWEGRLHGRERFCISSRRVPHSRATLGLLDCTARRADAADFLSSELTVSMRGTVLKILCLRIPVVDGQFDAIDLMRLSLW